MKVVAKACLLFTLVACAATDAQLCGRPIAPFAAYDSLGGRYRGRAHAGLDVAADVGEPLRAPVDGRIQSVHTSELGGLTVSLYSRHALRVTFSHLGAAYVTRGQEVRAGETIGATGCSGAGCGDTPHVHIAVCWSWIGCGAADGDLEGLIDPAAWLTRPGIVFPVACPR